MSARMGTGFPHDGHSMSSVASGCSALCKTVTRRRRAGIAVVSSLMPVQIIVPSAWLADGTNVRTSYCSPDRGGRTADRPSTVTRPPEVTQRGASTGRLRWRGQRPRCDGPATLDPDAMLGVLELDRGIASPRPGAGLIEDRFERIGIDRPIEHGELNRVSATGVGHHREDRVRHPASPDAERRPVRVAPRVMRDLGSRLGCRSPVRRFTAVSPHPSVADGVVGEVRDLFM